jgi:hypothetical protein
VSKGRRHSFIVGPHRRNSIQRRIAESPLNKDFLRASHIWHPEKVRKQQVATFETGFKEATFRSPAGIILHGN